jgi:hypothetical protein
MMLHPKLLENFFQFGYVTTDLDTAMALYRDRFDVPEFYILPAAIPTRTAFAWVGDTMVELIQPGDDKYRPIYIEALPKSGIALHHLGYRVHDEHRWLEILAGLAAYEIPTTRLQIPPELGMEVLYADARAQLGHYVEYIWNKAGMPDFFRNVPRAPRYTK